MDKAKKRLRIAFVSAYRVFADSKKRGDIVNVYFTEVKEEITGEELIK